MTDTRKLKAKLVEKGLTLDDLAKCIRKSRTMTSYKMNNHSEFKVSEISKISDLLDLTLEEKEEIFFAQ